MTATRYVKGSGKEITFDNGGSILNLSINKEDFNSLPDTKGYIKLQVCKRKQPDQYGQTHYIKLNDYKPKEKSLKKELTTDMKEEDLPF